MAGNLSFTLLGARLPTVGGSATGFGGGGGVFHDEKAWPHCTFAKGFETSSPPPVPAPPSPPLAPEGLESFAGHEGRVTLLRPAFRRASLAARLLSMALTQGLKEEYTGGGRERACMWRLEVRGQLTRREELTGVLWGAFRLPMKRVVSHGDHGAHMASRQRNRCSREDARRVVIHQSPEQECLENKHR
jgi:hypothetical protein